MCYETIQSPPSAVNSLTSDTMAQRAEQLLTDGDGMNERTSARIRSKKLGES